MEEAEHVERAAVVGWLFIHAANAGAYVLVCQGSAPKKFLRVIFPPTGDTKEQPYNSGTRLYPSESERDDAIEEFAFRWIDGIFTRSPASERLLVARPRLVASASALWRFS